MFLFKIIINYQITDIMGIIVSKKYFGNQIRDFRSPIAP